MIFDDTPTRPMFLGRESEILALQNHFSGGQQLAAIVGDRGSGKTTLANIFTEWAESSSLFPGGSRRISLTGRMTIEDVFPSPSSAPSLIVLDDFEFAERPIRQAIRPELARQRNLSALVCAKELPPSDDLNSALLVRLGGLSQTDFRKLIEAALLDPDRQAADRLFKLVAGIPLYADLAGTAARELQLSLPQVIRGLADFRHSGILGPDGRPLSDIPEQARIAVVDASAALVERLRSDPTMIRELSSRQFEEFVAELLGQQGYEVELTPPSKDGGFDIFAARRDGLGKFLFLVECKRYTPPNKVGVSIVRELHGVVHEKRATAGVVVTSSFFTRGAKEFQERLPHQIQLHDYLALQQWLGILDDERPDTPLTL